MDMVASAHFNKHKTPNEKGWRLTTKKHTRSAMLSVEGEQRDIRAIAASDHSLTVASAT
ncbi:uncharacterized protein PHALS_08305 [Plasmopara halstedii]|uniref:Uncharacterized protein n=1 Tax=Plasmopara halstedii TaxID=4781 RepID=A0A0P1ABI5_PLAHL|nr:uncharacterized protein PHALS_08305 [Plasmopara halstedii]CEG38218.1 hypothetical protein PHALS_08305 [Plasmopara halstedii]|eukprot:XP_024574587.1 hypothetical protein PHALS_08305 [Plasmopara halstedii]